MVRERLNEDTPLPVARVGHRQRIDTGRNRGKQGWGRELWKRKRRGVGQVHRHRWRRGKQRWDRGINTGQGMGTQMG